MSVTRSWPSRQRRIFHNCRDPSLARSLARRSMDFTFYTVMLETPTFYSFTLEFCTLNLMAAFSLSLEECLCIIQLRWNPHQALANAEPNFSHKEYKGTPPQGRSGAVSRVLSVAVKGENVYIELKSGPGKLTATGAITPDGKPEVEVNVAFKLYEARRLGATVLAYIQAWDVMRMLANKHAVSPPLTYLMVPTAAESNGRAPGDNRPAAAANGHGRPLTRHGPAIPAPVAAAGNGAVGRVTPPSQPPAPPQAKGGEQTTAAAPASGPATIAPIPPDPPARPDTEAIAQAIYGPAEASPTLPAAAEAARPLRYGDGTAVDASNAAEAQTFRRYLAEKNEAPASKSALQVYYRQQKPA
jgi:hypothetical protein